MAILKARQPRALAVFRLIRSSNLARLLANSDDRPGLQLAKRRLSFVPPQACRRQPRARQRTSRAPLPWPSVGTARSSSHGDYLQSPPRSGVGWSNKSGYTVWQLTIYFVGRGRIAMQREFVAARTSSLPGETTIAKTVSGDIVMSREAAALLPPRIAFLLLQEFAARDLDQIIQPSPPSQIGSALTRLNPPLFVSRVNSRQLRSNAAPIANRIL
jgi:hypothetical protein